MKRTFLPFFLLVMGCSLPFHHSHPETVYYLTSPLKGVNEVGLHSDSISVYFDDRTLFWMNAVLMNARSNLQEDAACLHISKNIGDTAFYVDSLEISAKMVTPEGYGPLPSWKGIRSMCPPETAPIHWHVVTPTWFGALKEGNWPAEFIIKHRCELSPPDVQPLMSRYDFVAMQCGFGRDSVIVHKVKRR